PAPNHVHYIRSALVYLVYKIALKSCPLEPLLRTPSGNQLETHLREFPSQLNNLFLVLIVDADEHRPFARQMSTAPLLSLQVRAAKIFGDAHNLARRPHLRSKHRINPREFGERKHWRLDVEPLNRQFARQFEFRELPADHQFGRNLSQRNSGRLGHERYRTRGSRVHFKDVDAIG